MAKKTKADVTKSEDRYGTTFGSAVWRADSLELKNDCFLVQYTPYNDSTAADADSDPLPGTTTLVPIRTTLDCDSTAATAISSAISGLTDEEKLSTLGCCLLKAIAAIHVADPDSAIYGGTVV